MVFVFGARWRIQDGRAGCGRGRERVGSRLLTVWGVITWPRSWIGCCSVAHVSSTALEWKREKHIQ